jgi:hypothetical protein
MCVPEDLTGWKRLRHDFKNTYYRGTLIYLTIMVTVIVVLLATGPVI